MRISIDIDGVLAENDGRRGVDPWLEYFAGQNPIEAAVESLAAMKRAGHVLTLYTARHEESRQITESWLRRHGFQYDFLVMGKPEADIYIDDKAFRFTRWSDMMSILESIENG